MDLKRTRIKYSRKQTELLEHHFDLSQYPDTETQEKLALEIGVTTDRISIWFQNRRSKFKRQCHTHHVTWMRKQIFSSNEDKTCALGTPRLPVQMPACHVLSPLESQTHRNDVPIECSPGLFSPLGTISCQQRLNKMGNTTPGTPELFRGQYTSTVRTSGQCMKDNTNIIVPSIADAGHENEPKWTPNIFPADQKLALYSTGLCPDLTNQQSATTTQFTDELSSCGVNKQLPTNTSWTREGLADTISKENLTPRACRVENNISRTSLVERLSNVDEFITTDASSTPNWSRDEGVFPPRWPLDFGEYQSQFVPSFEHLPIHHPHIEPYECNLHSGDLSVTPENIFGMNSASNVWQWM